MFAMACWRCKGQLKCRLHLPAVRLRDGFLRPFIMFDVDMLLCRWSASANFVPLR